MGASRLRTSQEQEQDKVYFHPEQMKYLEKIFCTVVHTPHSTENEMRHYNGQQSVLEFIRNRVQR